MPTLTAGDRSTSPDEFIHFQINYWLYRLRIKKATSAIKYIKAAECWAELIEFARDECDHFNHLYCSARSSYKDSGGGDSLRDPVMYLKISKAVHKEIQRHRLLGWSPGDPISLSFRRLMFSHQHAQKFKDNAHGVMIERTAVRQKPTPAQQHPRACTHAHTHTHTHTRTSYIHHA